MQLGLSVFQPPLGVCDGGDGGDALPLDLVLASDREPLVFSLLLALSQLSGFWLLSMRSRRINRRSGQLFSVTSNAAAHAPFNFGLLIWILGLSSTMPSLFDLDVEAKQETALKLLPTGNQGLMPSSSGLLEIICSL